jgi:DNA-binding beta-propeller fold protein YncE/ABC-type spermidine/putrescine transport system permease subunit II
LAVVFVLALNQFAVPALLQVRVYPAEIWLRYNGGLDATGALLMSWPMILAPSLLLLWAWRRDVPWPRVSGGVTPHLARERLGWPLSVAAGIGSGMVLTLAVVLPLWQLLWNPGTWAELGPAFRAGRGAMLQSALLSGATATAVLLVAWCTARHRSTALLWLAFLIPGVVMGVVLIKLFNRPSTAVLYRSSLIVLLAWGLRYFAPGWALVRRALLGVDPLLSDVARMEGATPWQHFRWVVWPQVGKVFSAAWLLVFLLCLWDTETLVLVMPPGGETLALRIFNFLHYGHNAQVNALCLLLVLVALVPGVLWLIGHALMRTRLFRRFQARAVCLPLGAAIVFLGGCQPADSSQASLPSSIFAQAKVLGERGSGAGQFQKPRSVAVDDEDNVYVVDLTGRVQKFSPDGEYLAFWQMPQTELGKPKGMARDERGGVVVLEPHYARVNHFTPGGDPVEQWGSRGTNIGQINFPRAVAVAPDGHVYISEYMQQERVQVFTPDRKIAAVIGRPGRAEGEFNRAEGLSLDHEGRLYVADSCNHRVQVFAADGHFLRAIGSAGSGPAEMSYPYDVAVDHEGRLYVCEFGNSRIQVFDREGQWLETIGGPGAAPGQFNNPWSIAIDSQGNLYVADAMNHRVQKLVRDQGS